MIRLISKIAICLAVVTLFPALGNTWTENVGLTQLHNEGPLAIDIDVDGSMDFLVSNSSSIRIFKANSEEWNFELEIVDEAPPAPYDAGSHYQIHSVAAGGLINDDIYPDIAVGVWSYFSGMVQGLNVECYLHKVYVWISQSDAEGFDGYTRYCVGDGSSLGSYTYPILHDIDMDGEMEVFLFGYSKAANGQPHNYLGVYTFNTGNNTLETLFDASVYDNPLPFDGVSDWCSFSVSDLESSGSGHGETDVLFVVSGGLGTQRIHCLTVDENCDVDDKANFPVFIDVEYVQDGICLYRGGGINLADANSDGNLDIFVPVDVYEDGFGQGVSPLYPAIVIFNPAGTRISYFPELGANNTNPIPNEKIWSSTPAIFDFGDNGLLGVAFTTETDVGDGGHIYAFEQEANRINWDYCAGWSSGHSLPGNHPGNYSPTVGELVTDANFGGIDITILVDMDDGGQGGDGLLSCLSLENGGANPTSLDDRIDYNGGAALFGQRETVPAIGYFDGDNNLDIVYNAEGSLRFKELANISPGFEEIEWSQFQNGPMHNGVYAYPFEGSLLDGTTIWQNRINVTDDINCGGIGKYLTIKSNTVVEVNEDCWLTFHSPYVTIEDNVVIKPNSSSDDAFVHFGPFFQVSEMHFRGAQLVFGENDEIEFENCTFTGEDFGTAISGNLADLTFTNCTFIGYDNAVVLTGCTGSIVNCTFEDCDNNAIKLMNCTGTFSIEECEISGMGEGAIYLYNSNPDIEECEIYDNDCGSYGGAIYTYNSTPHLRDNYIHDNDYAGFKAVGGGYPRFSTFTLTDPHRNFLEDNNLYTHTPRADSTWSEMIIGSPTYLCIFKGHNDISNIAGDYLISNWAAGTATVSATYNYWVTSGTLSSDDFYPTNSVTFTPADASANYVSDFNDETAAEEIFALATQRADSGLYQSANQDLRSIISTYPSTHVAQAALRMIKDIGPKIEISQASLQSYFAGVAENNAVLEVYANRLANLCLVDARNYVQALQNYDDALEDVENRVDSLYFAIDRAYAVIAQLQNEEGNLDAVDRNSNHAAIDEVENQIRRMMADLNGMPLPEGLAERQPEEFLLTACYPNPFNSTITISYKLPEANRVMVGVYDLNGREVARLTDDVQNAGQHTITWNADNYSSGVYLVRVEALGKVNSRKIVLCK